MVKSRDFIPMATETHININDNFSLRVQCIQQTKDILKIYLYSMPLPTYFGFDRKSYFGLFISTVFRMSACSSGLIINIHMAYQNSIMNGVRKNKDTDWPIGK